MIVFIVRPGVKNLAVEKCLEDHIVIAFFSGRSEILTKIVGFSVKIKAMAIFFENLNISKKTEMGLKTIFFSAGDTMCKMN